MEILQILVTFVAAVAIAIATAVVFIALTTPLAFELAFFLCAVSQTRATKGGRTAPNYTDIIAAHLLLFMLAAMLTLAAELARTLIF